MNLKELAETIGYSENMIKGHFSQVVKKYKEKTGLTIIKEGVGTKATYGILEPKEIRADKFYNEKDIDKNFYINDELIGFTNMKLSGLIGLMAKPSVVYRGTYKMFLEYIGITPTAAAISDLRIALKSLDLSGYVMYKEDPTDESWFILGLTRHIEMKMGVGIEQIRKCRELAENSRNR